MNTKSKDAYEYLVAHHNIHCYIINGDLYAMVWNDELKDGILMRIHETEVQDYHLLNTLFKKQ